MMMRAVFVATVGLTLYGCGTINTVISSDANAISKLRVAKTRCEAIPQIYSGVSYDLCILHGPPQVGEHDPAAPALIPLQVLDLIPSGIADTLLLPYTIYLQHSEGSLDL